MRTQVGIGVENIYESDFTLVLGFIYTLIVKYEIERYGADVKDLLRWLKRQVAGFDTAMAMDLRNFTACLADGMCARYPASTTPAATMPLNSCADWAVSPPQCHSGADAVSYRSLPSKSLAPSGRVLAAMFNKQLPDLVPAEAIGVDAAVNASLVTGAPW